MRRDELFERLEPPPGGLAALRARLDVRPQRVPRRATLAFALAAAAVLLFAMSRARPRDVVASARQRGDAPEIALGLAPMPGAAVAIEPQDRATTALTEVRTADPRVAFYWVSSTAWSE